MSDAVGCSEAIDKILSAKTVLRFGVARRRPPRRSPSFEPRATLHRPPTDMSVYETLFAGG